ncbi:bifunctional DNA primase/polymerase [Thermus scotoductus]|uniref:bifunctional DNA primase/polymerase n=1 Tax=Thermus scotoductus TaxID=37636 RepID=UPI0009DCFE92|nr:bifunctional DNA primase/polymerase [Thermus scotoductus]
MDAAKALEAALGYARMGYAVLPLAPGEKRPHPGLVPHGLKEASREEATLEAWWRACPWCGVGILAPEGVLVLDIDDPEAWERLREEHPVFLEAPRQRTPKGGVHVFLRLPEGVRLSASVRALEGVDLRGMGRAYVVAAPTRLKDGRTYAWEVPLVRPEELPPVPQDLLLKLLPPPPPPREVWTPVEGTSPKRLQALLQAYAAQVARTPEGQRHNTLIRYAVAAGGLLPHGLDPREAEEALVGAALEAGLPEPEARAAARWGLEVGTSRPLALEPPGFSANGGVFRKAVCGKPEPSPSQKSVFRKTATYRIGGLRKRRGVV